MTQGMSIDEDWEQMARKYNGMRNGFSDERQENVSRRRAWSTMSGELLYYYFFLFIELLH